MFCIFQYVRVKRPEKLRVCLWTCSSSSGGYRRGKCSLSLPRLHPCSVVFFSTKRSQVLHQHFPGPKFFFLVFGSDWDEEPATDALQSLPYYNRNVWITGNPLQSALINKTYSVQRTDKLEVRWA